QPLEELAKALVRKGHSVLIETNGTIAPSKELRRLVSIWSVSPKTSNAGFSVKYGQLEWLSDVKDYYLKFVVVNPRKDTEEILAFLDERGINHSKVILQPDGMREDYVDVLRGLMNYVIDEKIPLRVLPQLHRLAWGHKRGV
ncbi:MAG: radical SAM protein, partial [Thaumarchaeota archaeon]|nr:radical SAM protein [Nitrososphaerota archaeon]